MRICFLLGGFSRNGGIGRVTSIIANELAKNPKYEIITISAYSSPNESTIYSLDKNIKQIYLFDELTSVKEGLIKKNSIVKLRKILKDFKVDVIISCGVLFFPLAILSSLFLGIRTISWEHTNAEITHEFKYEHIFRHFGAKFSDEVIVLTSNDAKVYKETYNRENCKIFPNPIDDNLLKVTNEYNDSSKKIISVGRLEYQKYFQSLIQVAIPLFDSVPDWSWDIYGEGSDREELENLIRQNNLTNNVFLKGQVSDLYERYNEYSVLVMTSRYEGFPMTLLEGMASNLPLISYDIKNGPNDIIVDGVNGFLIPPFDSGLMASSLIKMINNRGLRKEFSKNNIGLKKRFTLDTIIENWTTVINMKDGVI